MEQSFVLHSAPGASQARVTFAYSPGHPSDGSQAIMTSGVGGWTMTLPKSVTVQPGADRIVTFKLKVPSSASAGVRTGVILVNVTGVMGINGQPGAGQTLRIPVFASVTLHDPNVARGNASGPTAAINTSVDVFSKSDTFWPNVIGQPGTGSNADWLVYPVDLAGGLSEATFTAWDTAGLNNTYDLYVYDARFDLIVSTHPFATDGVTDTAKHDGRGASTETDPARLALTSPAGGRYYVALSRAKVGRSYVTAAGDFGSATLRLDEVR